MKLKLFLLITGLIIGFVTCSLLMQERTKNETLLVPKETPIANVETTSAEGLKFRNSFKTMSFLSTKDINNDGIDELIYEPRSLSWHNKTIILSEDVDKNILVPFCNHCEFETYSSSPEFKDLNNDGLLDIVLPLIMDSNDNQIENVIYYFDGSDFKIKN